MNNFLLACMLLFSGRLPAKSPVIRIPLHQQWICLDSTIVNARAVRDFRKRFTTVNDEIWYAYKNRYTAFFADGDVKFRIEYDSRGNWSGTEKDYYEAKLPRNVRKVVKTVYFDYRISWIREISVPELFSGPVYIMQIEDADSFKNLSVYNEEMNVLSDYQKD